MAGAPVWRSVTYVHRHTYVHVLRQRALTRRARSAQRESPNHHTRSASGAAVRAHALLQDAAAPPGARRSASGALRCERHTLCATAGARHWARSQLHALTRTHSQPPDAQPRPSALDVPSDAHWRAGARAAGGAGTACRRADASAVAAGRSVGAAVRRRGPAPVCVLPHTPASGRRRGRADLELARVCDRQPLRRATRAASVAR